jgi:hypothetical protein
VDDNVIQYRTNYYISLERSHAMTCCFPFADIWGMALELLTNDQEGTEQKWDEELNH